jgi:hypothetical protein
MEDQKIRGNLSLLPEESSSLLPEESSLERYQELPVEEFGEVLFRTACSPTITDITFPITMPLFFRILSTSFSQDELSHWCVAVLL